MQNKNDAINNGATSENIMETTNDNTENPETLDSEEFFDADDSSVIEENADNSNELLASAKEEIAALREQLLRLAADFDNYRKRTTREQQEIREYGVTQLLQDILPVLDNFDRALYHTENDNNPVIDGIRLVSKQLIDTLARHGVQSFVSLGESFDPERHEAIAQLAVSSEQAGTIVEELQKGYMLRARLLRPAKVVVAIAPPDTNKEDTTE
ncbi:MAG: nucleotide exchange factor GrpE [Deltaproteobacteria bacterium]|nr:nucleotide exchange factor GrpE [Deltaproteobacteria bacterium]